MQKEFEERITNANKTEDINGKSKVIVDELVTELEDIEKKFDGKQDETRKPMEDLATLKGKMEVTKEEINEVIEGLNRDKINISKKIENTKLEMNTKTKGLLEIMNNLRQEYSKETEDANPRFEEEIETIQKKKDEKSQIQAETSQCISNNRKFTLQIDILKRQIRTLESIIPSQNSQPSSQKLLPPASIPRRRTWDEMSDSSMEGTSYTPQQLSILKRNQERRRLVRIIYNIEIYHVLYFKYRSRFILGKSKETG